MIDNNLIQLTTKTIAHSLHQKKEINNSLFVLTDVLPKLTSEKLKNYVLSVDQSKWQSFEEDYYQKHRQKITWDSDTIIEELHCAFENVTNEINSIFPKQQQHNFIGISLWKDTAGYESKWHTDNELLSCALQLYLFDAPEKFGTTFDLIDYQYKLPFVHNTAYLADQSVRPMLLHRASETVPKNLNRYSLYVSWSFSQKLPD